MNGVRGLSEYTLSKNDTKYLCRFHIVNKDHFTHQDKQQIKPSALILYANVEAKNVHNDCALKEVNTDNNPVTIINAQTKRLKDNTRSKNMSHYDNEQTPALINIARNTQVQITGTNLYPKWGLYHRVRGKVLDIVY